MATVHYKSTDGDATTKIYTFVGVPLKTAIKIEALSKKDPKYLALILLILANFEVKLTGGTTMWNIHLENEFNTHFPA